MVSVHYRRRFARVGASLTTAKRRKKIYKIRRSGKIRRQIGVSGLLTKIRREIDITSVGTTYANFIYLRNAEDALDWTGLSALYDFYRVHMVKLTYTPSRPNDENTLATFRPFYIVTDQDDFDNSAFTGLDVYRQYDRCAIRNLYRPWTYVTRVSKMISATRINKGTTSPLNVLGSGHYDINTRPDNGIITMRAESLSNNVEYGKLLITYYVSFKERR